MAKSSSKRLLNFDYLFTNRCSVGEKGFLRGPGFLCGFYLFLIVIGIIAGTGLNLYSLFENNDISKVKLILYTVLSLAWSVFVFYFMYSACYMCSGFRGFIIVAVFGLLVNFVVMHLFKDVILSQMEMINNK